MIERGSVHWADLGEAAGSRPAKRRPVVVVSADAYNASRLATVVALVISSNTSLANMPGNVFLSASASGLPKDSVANVTAVVTLNKSDLDQYVGVLPTSVTDQLDRGLLAALDL